MIKSTGILRSVDELGRVVLPIEARRKLDLKEKDSLELLLDEENGQIILQKASKTCIKCGGVEHLKELCTGCYLCSSCINGLT